MSEENRHPEIAPQLEARLVAFVLGEASDFEQEELQRLIARQPELAAFVAEMRQVDGLLSEVAAGELADEEDEWKLSADKRESVLSNHPVVDATTNESVEIMPASNEINKASTGGLSAWKNYRGTVVNLIACLLLIGVLYSLLAPTIYFATASSKAARSRIDAIESLSYADAEKSMPLAKFESGGESADSSGFEPSDSPVHQAELSDMYLNDFTAEFISPQSGEGEGAAANKPRTPANDFGEVTGGAGYGGGLGGGGYGGGGAQGGDAGGNAGGEQNDKWFSRGAERVKLGSDVDVRYAESGQSGERKKDFANGVVDSRKPPEVVLDAFGSQLQLSQDEKSSPSPVLAVPQLPKTDAIAVDGSASMNSDLLLQTADDEETLEAGRVARFGRQGGAFDQGWTQGSAGEQSGPGQEYFDSKKNLSKPAEQNESLNGQVPAFGGFAMPDSPDSSQDNRFDYARDPGNDRGMLSAKEEQVLEKPESLSDLQSGTVEHWQGREYGLEDSRKTAQGMAERRKMLGDDPFGNGVDGEERDEDGDGNGDDLFGDSGVAKSLDDVAANGTWMDVQVPDPVIRNAKTLEELTGRRDRYAEMDLAKDEDDKAADHLSSSIEDANKQVLGYAIRLSETRARQEASNATEKQQSEQVYTVEIEGRRPRTENYTVVPPVTESEKFKAKARSYRVVPPQKPAGQNAWDKRFVRPESVDTRFFDDFTPSRVRKGKGLVRKSRAAAGLNEKDAQRESFSTFSLHVSDVSFKLAQVALAKGELPDVTKVRIEEFVNAFDYGDPLPCGDEKVTCSLEQAIHPFIQQRNVLRVALRTGAEGRASNTPLRLTFLLDNSGSMERADRQDTIRRAFATLAKQLKANDQATLITFARQPRLIADRVDGTKASTLVSMIDNLPSEGGTNIEAALRLAFEKAREQQTPGAQNRIIMLTDGAVNLGNANPESLSQLVIKMREAGIAFDAAGISADGLNDDVLEALTRKGDGRYYLLDSAESADSGFARQIAGALRPSAKNVKVQVEFNQDRVGKYKLLGFEKHRLKKEDFRNDKVDAAEMAAAEAGVAMYQFEAKPDGVGDVGTVSVRFRDLSSGQMVEKRWPIPYRPDAPRPEQASPTIRIGTAAAMTAAKLRGEALGQTVELGALTRLVDGLPARWSNLQRVQQLQQMIQQSRQIYGE